MSTITAAHPAEEGTSKISKHDLRAFKTRDNHTNIYYIAKVYLIMGLTLGATIGFHIYQIKTGLSLWWSFPVFLLAIVIIGASQHQLGGAIHEATHYMLFRNRKFSELASDWLCAFPLYTTTYQFRIHHLAHHQFVNDPERDPDIAQLRDSGHWLDFPIDHITFLWALLKQLWLPNLIRYTLTRARYSALGVDTNPYNDATQKNSKWPVRIGLSFAIATPFVFLFVISFGNAWLLMSIMIVLWAGVVGIYALIPKSWFPATRIQPVISHRLTTINRITFIAIIYGALSWIQLLTGAPAWGYFSLLWIVPLFTTFPIFMILRQWVQHGNGDRGRLTNTRVFLVNPFIRYAIFPFGMDYHLPHHLYASVPHYRLKNLHDALMQDPEYVKEGVVVEGYFTSPHSKKRNPTVLDVLGPGYANHGDKTEAYIDSHVLDDAEVVGRKHIEREEELSIKADKNHNH